MAISINPIFPVIAAQGAAADVVLQPGTVINAQVLKVLANDMVRIAIANLSIEVMSEIPLQPGQTLQLAVSQMPEGIKLAVVGQGGSSQPAAPIADTVTLAPDAPVSSAAKPAAVQSPANQLTALEALAVSAAAQTAATKQASMSQLFANLGTAVAADGLPPLVQQAAMQLLARRPPLDAVLSGDEIKTAFETSGLFLEKTLATGAPSSAGSNAMPDLKAALVVFRQLLSSQLGDAPATGSSQPQAGAPQAAVSSGAQTASPQIAAAGEPLQATGFTSPPGGATLVPELDVQEILLPQARVPVADDFSETGEVFRFVAPNLAAGTGAATAATAETRIALNLMQEALAISGEGTLPGVQARAAAIVDEAAFAHTNTPPPPIRDALPSPQPVAAPTLAPGASVSETARHLLQDTDAAIARQTLLQVASLPDRADAATLRNDTIGPRWNFEIPFATPLGTAVAQFEIARDGSGNEVESTKRVWRARFSLDVEPAGPVHAVVSLIGDTTSVRMWAERPATASQLRAGASQLSQALSHAELTPGDIVIRDGSPPQTATAQAGHFLDRAL